MASRVTFEEAQKEFLGKYDNGKVGRQISLGDKLFYAYKDFCYLKKKRSHVSTRIQILLVKDIMENE